MGLFPAYVYLDVKRAIEKNMPMIGLMLKSEKNALANKISKSKSLSICKDQIRLVALLIISVWVTANLFMIENAQRISMLLGALLALWELIWNIIDRIHATSIAIRIEENFKNCQAFDPPSKLNILNEIDEDEILQEKLSGIFLSISEMSELTVNKVLGIISSNSKLVGDKVSDVVSEKTRHVRNKVSGLFNYCTSFFGSSQPVGADQGDEIPNFNYLENTSIENQKFNLFNSNQNIALLQ